MWLKVHWCNSDVFKIWFSVKGMLKSHLRVRNFKLYSFSVCHSHVVRSSTWKCSHILNDKKTKNETFCPVSVPDVEAVIAITPGWFQFFFKIFLRTTSKSRHFWPKIQNDRCFSHLFWTNCHFVFPYLLKYKLTQAWIGQTSQIG